MNEKYINFVSPACESSSVVRKRLYQGRGHGFEPRFLLELITMVIYKLKNMRMWRNGSRAVFRWQWSTTVGVRVPSCAPFYLKNRCKRNIYSCFFIDYILR